MNEIRKSNRSVFNRVQSIVEDAEFVSSVQNSYKRPLVPNKRCGLWYVPPEDRASDSYFKSTDGHTGQWAFSLKRLNLHLLPLIEENGGIIIVDSTRRGKSMPDSLSKTIPIWCAVINQAYFGECEPQFPKTNVSASEIDAIKALIPQWAEQLKSQVPAALLMEPSKPLRPLWVTAESPLPMIEFSAKEPIFEDSHAIILCTASRKAQDGELVSSGFTYVQGAADDHELWAPAAFTSEMLWQYPSLREKGVGDTELLRRIHGTIEDEAKNILNNVSSEGYSGSLPLRIRQVHPHICIAHGPSAAPIPVPSEIIIDLRSGKKLGSNHWPLPRGKKGSKQLGYELKKICDFFEENFRGEIIVAADAGTDFAECVSLLLDCRYFDEYGNRLTEGKASYVTKDEVTRRNMKIIALSGLAPSRTTQNVVGAFLRK